MKMRGVWLSVLLLIQGVCLDAASLDIWISSVQDQQYYEKMVELYKKKVQPGFSANIHAYGFREMPDKLQIAMKTGKNTPDIIQLDEIFFGMYLGEKIPFVDLSEKVKTAGLAAKFSKPRLKLFSHKGRQYGLPQSLGAILLYYRGDIFDKYKITPAMVETWDGFVETMAKMARAGKSSLALDWSYLEILVRQRGGDLFDADGRPQFTSPLVVDTLKRLKDLQEKGIALLPDRGTIFDPVFFSGDISNEEVFCVLGADWYGLDMIQQFAPELSGQWRALPLPVWKDALSKGSRRTSAFAGQGLMIYEGSPQVESAWAFMRFVMEDKDANIQRYQMGNSFPAYEPAWKEPELLKPSAYFSGQSLGGQLVALAPDVPDVVTCQQRARAVYMLRENIFSSVMQGIISPEDAMKRMDKSLQGGPERPEEGEGEGE